MGTLVLILAQYVYGLRKIFIATGASRRDD